MSVTKLAEVLLQDHQDRVLKRLQENQKGLIAYHSMGSGKTLTALKAIEQALDAQPDKKALVITPASLVTNITKELDKHKLPIARDKLDVLSYEKATRLGDDLDQKYSLAVFDEAHRLRNDGTQVRKAMSKLIDNSDKTLLLSGTAGYNNPADMLNLVKLLDNKLNVGASKDFSHRYINDKTWELQNTSELRPIFKKYIDIYDTPRNTQDFPKTTNKVITVPMSKDQFKLYKNIEKHTIPSDIRKAMQDNKGITMNQAANLNMFSQGVRQISNTPWVYSPNKYTAEDSPKILAAVKSMTEASQEPGFRGVAYSNYLDAGIRPYANLLRAKGIEPLIYTGELNKKEKQNLINEFNTPTNNPKVLLLSSSGAEGIDLKGVNKMQLLDPHFNKAKLDQVKARAVRYKSHEHLPKDKQVVDIEEYRAVGLPSFFQKLFKQPASTTIDSYLDGLATKKQKLIEEMRELSR